MPRYPVCVTQHNVCTDMPIKQGDLGQKLLLGVLTLHNIPTNCGSGGRWFESTQLYQPPICAR
jgi:hypothetical protein